jgi:phage-related protein
MRYALFWVSTALVFQVARFEEGIHVLHALEKRSRRMSRLDLEIGARRCRTVIKARGRA